MPVHSPEHEGILKVATDTETTRALSREILAGLSLPFITSEIDIPRILSIGRYEGRLCFIAERIETNPLGTVENGDYCEDDCVEMASSAVLAISKIRNHPLMRIIQAITPQNRYGVEGKLRYYQSLLHEIREPDPQIAETLSKLLYRAGRMNTRFLPSPNHGDLTLWHIYPHENGKPCLIDWENWSPRNNVLGWDLAHLYARTRQFHGKKPYGVNIVERAIDRIRQYSPEYADIVELSFPILTLFATTSLARETCCHSVQYDTFKARQNLIELVEDIEKETLLS